jgi:hypothetical protein
MLKAETRRLKTETSAAKNAESAGKTKTERGIGFGHRDHGGGGEHGGKRMLKAENLKAENRKVCRKERRDRRDRKGARLRLCSLPATRFSLLFHHRGHGEHGGRKRLKAEN